MLCYDHPMKLKNIFTSKKQVPLRPVAVVIAGSIILYTVLQTLAGNGLSVLEGAAVAALQIGIVAAVFAPFVYVSFRRAAKRSKSFSVQRSLGLLGLSALIYLGYVLIVTAPRLEWFADLQFNWQGKILALIAMIVLIVLWRGLSWKNIGFTKPKPGTWWRLGVTSLAIVLVWTVIAGAPETPSLMPNAETILFQAFIPSLDEELIWRGILWVLIAQAFPATRRFSGYGWSLLITTALFAVGHMINIQSGFVLSFAVVPLITTGIAGFVLGWIRARSGSIIPAMILHTVLNLSAVIVPALLYR